MALPKPLIAAVSGYAVAGGLELALLADLRVVEHDAVFGVFCRRWGVPLIDGGTVRLPRIVGMGRALDMILTGRAVHADEALAMGLASRVVGPGEALPAAQQLAREIAALPQLCMLADRASVYAQWALPLDAALRQEGAHGTPMVFAEGMAGAARFADGAGAMGRRARRGAWGRPGVSSRTENARSSVAVAERSRSVTPERLAPGSADSAACPASWCWPPAAARPPRRCGSRARREWSARRCRPVPARLRGRCRYG